MLNWNLFKVKYDKRESYAFELLSYLLFCAELENRVGLFRYKNQAGIETEPVEKDGYLIGFQSKFYDTKIADNKKDIIDSIKTAKEQNPQLTKILFYLNIEFSESSKKGIKKPQYQVEIEKVADDNNLKIEWRVPSHFEIQLLQKENSYIYDLFFTIESSLENLMDDLKRHSENLLESIQSQIIYLNNVIKIDRTQIVKEIENYVSNDESLILNGEGGCGKTAIIKEFYEKQSRNIPIYIFKSTELNVNHLNDIFRFSQNYSFDQFLEVHKDEVTKVIVIDSAEKLAELVNTDLLFQFITTLIKENWKIIFTTRYSYLSDLEFHLAHNYKISVVRIDLPLLKSDELVNLAQENKFNLPLNERFNDRLTNLFYLNEYLLEYINLDKSGNVDSFIEIIWKKRIQNSIEQNNNIHIEREKCFLQIVQTRCNTGRFYVNADNLSKEAIFKLKHDEIIGYNEMLDGYFITHDIYEEWALNRIINREFNSSIDEKEFYNKIGESLPIRRAYRDWLSKQISDNTENIKVFIANSFLSDSIPSFWKDELLISVLLSDYSEIFFRVFDQEIISNDFQLLDRTIFLLRIACKEVDHLISNNELTINYLFTKPKGKGWESVINFIYKYRNEYVDDHLKIIFPLLTDWVKYQPKGISTRNSGLLALDIIHKQANTKDFYIHEDAETKILQIIYLSSNELKSELSEIFQKVIENKWTKHNDPYFELCSGILEKPINAISLIYAFPTLIIKICDLFWYRSPGYNHPYAGVGTEKYYSIEENYSHEYYPASAFQTPIFWLLQNNSFKETLDFIIEFTNKTVESYAKSSYGKNVISVDLHIAEGINSIQLIDYALWCMYRGTGSPVVPDLLQSIHMALEKVLLNYAKNSDNEILESYLIYILMQSRSASLTAVVSSIVLAFPNKFSKIALILFKTIEFFHFDTERYASEFHSKLLLSGTIPEKEIFFKERLETYDDKHRNISLETLIVNYQFFGIYSTNDQENSDLIDSIYSILDQHNIDAVKTNKNEKVTRKILLARMDRRTMSPSVKEVENGFILELNPELPPELKEHSDQAERLFEDQMKYSPLRLWSHFKFEGNEKAKIYSQYENDSQRVLKDVKELLVIIDQGAPILPMDDSIPSTACSALIRFYNKTISLEELMFCKEVVSNRIKELFKDSYKYQISDGVEASIHSIPLLMKLLPQDIINLKKILILSLCDDNWIGQYKRICDYTIETIENEKLWETSFDDAKSVLAAFIQIKPFYNSIYKEELSKHNWGRQIQKQSIIKRVENLIDQLDFVNIKINIEVIPSFPIEDLEILFQLIPSDTQNSELLNLVELMLPKVSELLVHNRDHESNRYMTRIKLFKKFAHFALYRKETEIQQYLDPFCEKLTANEESSQFIGAFVSAQDHLCQNNQFWGIWKMLYTPICSRCNYGYYTHQVLVDYLLAWKWWNEGIEKWHSLNEENLDLYSKIAKDLGENPAVLYSITRVLNTIGSSFIIQGIYWIHEIVSNNLNLSLKDLENNTIYYLEQLMRKYIFKYKDKLKQDINLKNKIILILDFMINRGSVHGFLLRESIL